MLGIYQTLGAPITTTEHLLRTNYIVLSFISERCEAPTFVDFYSLRVEYIQGSVFWPLIHPVGRHDLWVRGFRISLIYN